MSTPNEKPILMSGPMVKAILDGRKTQTRRVVKQQPDYTPNDCWSFYFKGTPPKDTGKRKYTGWKVNYTPTVPSYAELQMKDIVFGCPYGKVGDRLWVRETFYDDLGARSITDGLEGMYYRADGERHEQFEDYADLKWRPSIFMPRWASRITLEVTGVRAERLQDISTGDIKAEGFPKHVAWHTFVKCYRDKTEQAQKLHEYFAKSWDKINGKKHPWASNPWVWVIAFRRKGL